MTGTVPLNELGEFLNWRRSELPPVCSRPRLCWTLLARVLHLDDDERGYLFQLAGKTALTVRTAAPGSPTHERLSILASWTADHYLPAAR